MNTFSIDRTERPLIIAGPCAVESELQLLPLAERLAQAGATALRGGAFKPRTRPTDFAGLGVDGVALLAAAKRASGLPVISEALDEASLEALLPVVDCLQVGARNMHNGALLRKIGAAGKAVLLKRGFAADVDEWLHAADYLRRAGTSDIWLCERGIRTFSRHSRFTLDLSVVPYLKSQTDLPVIVDPSHATGRRESVAPMAKAALAAGADGVMIEVHPDPAIARCDGQQAITPQEFETLVRELPRLEPGKSAGERQQAG